MVYIHRHDFCMDNHYCPRPFLRGRGKNGLGNCWRMRVVPIKTWEFVHVCTLSAYTLTHWGPSLRAFWPRLSNLYSVLGLPQAPRVLGRVGF